MQLIVLTGLMENQTAPNMTAVSRGNQTRLELFGDEFDDWPAAIMQSIFDAA